MSKINQILKNKIIGISISESEDLQKLGFGDAHLIDAKIEIARYLLASGVTLMYGGDLRDDGYTRILFDLVESYSIKNFEKEYLINYLGWPLDYTLSEDLQASLSEKIKFVLPGLPIDIKKKPLAKKYLNPNSEKDYYLWARSMSYMRELMTKESDARVVLGGKTKGFKGRYPGILEEVYFSIKANKPIYLIGAYGGMTHDIIAAIQGETPDRLSITYQLDNISAKKNFEYYNKEKPNSEAKIDYGKMIAFLNNKGIVGLNNGLNELENKILFKTKHLPEIISLIIKGLIIKLGK